MRNLHFEITLYKFFWTLWEWAFAIVAFMNLYPYFMWSTLSSAIPLIIYRLLQIFVGGGALLLIPWDKFKIKKSYLIYVSILVFYYIYVECISNSNFGGIIIKTVLLATIFLVNSVKKKSIFKKFAFLFSISLIPGIAIQLSKIVNLQIPYKVILPTSQQKLNDGVLYKCYLGAVEGYYSLDEKFVRLCGMFDEPGVVGTVSGLLLSTGLVKNKLIWTIVFAGGIMSLSFAFFVIIAIYIFLKLIYKRQIILILAILFGLLCLVLITSQFPKGSLIYRYTYGRIGVEDGRIKADNRTSTKFDKEFSLFLKSDDIFTGVDEERFTEFVDGSSSYKVVIYRYGIIIFAILLYLIVKACSLSKDRFNEKFIINFPFAIVFLMSVYQRPDVINVPYLIILYGGLSNLFIKRRNGKY